MCIRDRGSRVGWMMNEFLIYHENNEVTSVTLNNYMPVVGSVLTMQAAVSYTHLDVYKRQVITLVVEAMGNGSFSLWHRRTMPCLLYTSRCV